MAKGQSIKSFTELEAWKHARQLHAAVCAACKQDSFRREFRLVAQIKSSANSVMANLAEGFEKGSRAEFHRFICIAKGSVGETLSHLHAALDDSCITLEQFESMSEMALRVGRIVGGLRKAVQPAPSKRRSP